MFRQLYRAMRRNASSAEQWLCPKVDSIVKPFVPIARMDAEKLILAVRARPPLWEQRSKQYHNRDVYQQTMGQEMTFPSKNITINIRDHKYEVCKLSNETGNVAPDPATLQRRDFNGKG
ncbi:hypothetical protein NQ318_012382, partial [Aromia moschata]